MQKEMQKQIDSGYYDDMFKNAQSSGSPWWKPYEDIGKSVGGGIKGGSLTVISTFKFRYRRRIISDLSSDGRSG